jgi:hypothetical protein
MNKFRKALLALLYLQIISFAISYAILFSTSGSNDFSGLIALPFLLAFSVLAFIDLIVFIVYLVMSFRRKQTLDKHIILLVLVAVIMNVVLASDDWGIMLAYRFFAR